MPPCIPASCIFSVASSSVVLIAPFFWFLETLHLLYMGTLASVTVPQHLLIRALHPHWTIVVTSAPFPHVPSLPALLASFLSSHLQEDGELQHHGQHWGGQTDNMSTHLVPGDLSPSGVRHLTLTLNWFTECIGFPILSWIVWSYGTSSEYCNFSVPFFHQPLGGLP